jgi:hypothetical protein
VRVLGTAFRVDWEPETQHFVLTVERGTVFASGPMLEGGRNVPAGARCDVEEPKGRLVLEPIEPERAPEVETASPEPAVEAPVVHERAESRVKKGAPDPRHGSKWQALERAGRFADALREAERFGLDDIYANGSAEDLLSLARAARFVGRRDVSSGALLGCRKRFPGTPEAAAAAYLMGRNAPPEQAVKWFSAYLAEEPAGTWAREASGRLVEAYQANGDTRAARDAAKRYLARYPAGPHADFAKKVLEN